MIRIQRISYEENATYGVLLSELGEHYHTIELPWKNNERNISCIPEGVYKYRIRSPKESGKFTYYHIHMLGVPNRSWILIHAANYVSELQGCIAPGVDRIDINNDKILDVTSSRYSVDEIVNSSYSEGNIQIFSDFKPKSM